MFFLCRTMQVLGYLFSCVLMPIALILTYIGFGGELPGEMTIHMETVDDGSSPIVYILYGILFAFLGYGFFRLGHLFGLFAKGRYFSLKGVQHMRIFAISFLALNLLTFARSQILAFQYGQWKLFPSKISGDKIGVFMLGITFLIIAHILNEALKNNDELDNYF